MVLRYFRKSANPPPQDSELPEEAITQSQQGNSEHASEEHSTAQNEQSDGDVTDSVVPDQHQAGGSSTTEVSIVDAQGQVERPILSAEDETFLKRAVSEEEPPELPPRPQIVAVSSGAKDNVVEDSTDAKDTRSSWKNMWAEYKTARDKTNVADDLMSAAEGLKTASEAQSDSDSDTKQEARDVNAVLRRLDLSAINNRVVGISNDTQKLMESFNQVLKDLINGVPTAYDDLERLLKDRQKQLDTLFGSLPPFLQKLVKSVPTKMYAYFAPQVAAAMTVQTSNQKAGSEKDDTAETSGDQKKTKKKFAYIPSLKELVTKKGSVAAMLRSIVSFLETRFPALLAGTNIVMSLAVFVLLFVFWYCYKRGREVRLAKESESFDISTSDLENSESKEATAESSSANDDNNAGLSKSADREIERKVELLAEDIERRP